MGIRKIVSGLSTLIVAIAFFMGSAALHAEEKKIAIPFYDAWLNSPHGNTSSKAFTHWNSDGAVPESCAACHSTTGHLDYLGVDGSSFGMVNKSAPVAEGVQCMACHNDESRHIEEIAFLSGLYVDRWEDDARCMACHQGRASGKAVSDMIKSIGVGNDQSSPDLKFINIHNNPVAATRFGSEAGGGYEYAGLDYDGFHYHDDYASQCNDCHDPHTTKVRVTLCAECHDEVASAADFSFIRSSRGDFDGDGDSTEGVKSEIEGLHALLYTAMVDYSREIIGTQVVYDADRFPYFFADSNQNGQRDEGEDVYAAWTPRLARAAYNYQFVAKDKGAFAHNARYVLQLLNDSVQDLGTQVSVRETSRPD